MCLMGLRAIHPRLNLTEGSVCGIIRARYSFIVYRLSFIDDRQLDPPVLDIQHHRSCDS
jgi:hypothetical protein